MPLLQTFRGFIYVNMPIVTPTIVSDGIVKPIVAHAFAKIVPSQTMVAHFLAFGLRIQDDSILLECLY